jgi:hypothetical protein
MSYHIFGDSNVSRYLPVVKETSSDPQYETITFTKVTNLVLLRDALSLPDVAHPVIIISALTNLLVAKYFDDFNEMLSHCKSVFTELLTWVQEGRDTCPGFAEQVYISLFSFINDYLAGRDLSSRFNVCLEVILDYLRSCCCPLCYAVFPSGSSDGTIPSWWSSTTCTTRPTFQTCSSFPPFPTLSSRQTACI